MRWHRLGGGNSAVGGPGKRWGHTCNAVRDGRLLYVFGGYGENNCQTNDVHVFDTDNAFWYKPNMRGVPPPPRDSHTCTTVGEKLFLFGGTDGVNPLEGLHILDTSSHTWIIPNVYGKGPCAREGHSAALVGRRLFIFGGCGKSGDDEVYYNDLYVLDTENFIWGRVATSGSVPCARDSHSCSSWRNKLVVVGGENASDDYLSDVYILDTDNFKWTELNTAGNILEPRAGHCAVAVGRNLFVFGGFSDNRNLFDDLYVLNINTGIWSKIGNLKTGPSARFAAAGSCLDAENGVLVLIGGCNESLEGLDDMFYFYTGMQADDVKAQYRREKLSLRKELKRKCQEKNGPTSGPMGDSKFPCFHLASHSSRPATVGIPSELDTCEEKTFEASLTGKFSLGFTIETRIDGQLLRGVVFSTQEPRTSSDAPSGRIPGRNAGSNNVQQNVIHAQYSAPTDS